jgi:hypothetical protein
VLCGHEIESLVIIVNLVKGCGWMIKAPFPFWMLDMFLLLLYSEWCCVRTECCIRGTFCRMCLDAKSAFHFLMLGLRMP